jgi:predicted ATPase
MQGKGEEGIAQMHQGLTDYRTTGAEVISSYFLALLAEAYGKVGRTEEGLSVLAEALDFVEQREERFYEAELYRIKGVLTLQKKFQVPGSKFQESNPQPLTPNSQVEQEAEGYFLKAIAIAQKQQAKSLELRAVMSLARLRQQQALEQSAKSEEARVGNTQHETRAKLAETHKLLSEVYNWFTEGFDTKDLQEAKALLAELATA